MLAENPHIQEKVLDEIKLNIIGQVTRDTTFSFLDYRQQMPYSQAVILECSRFGTVAPFGIPHRALRDTKIGQFDIPENTTVFINIKALNNDEKEIDEPMKYKPDRFLSADGNLGTSPKSYLPYGLGLRSCPGKSMGLLTTWIFMVNLVRKYRVSAPEEEGIKAEHCDNPLCGVPKSFKIVLERR